MTEFKPLEKPVTMTFGNTNYEWGGGKNWVLFAGPDIIEDIGLVIEVGLELKKISSRLGIPWILKCSYDKANRQSIGSFRGPGWKKAIEDLASIKSKVGCALLTDVHETVQVEACAEVADVVQIPAFLCRQTDLVVAAAKSGKVLHLKKGQFMAPWDMFAIVEKAKNVGNEKILLCERGTTFGYNRLVNDMTGLVEMRKSGKPVIMDISHSTQLPGANSGKSSGGRGEMSPALARAAMAVGVDGVFVETHPDPARALCDGETSTPLKQMESLVTQINAIWKTHTA